MSTTDQENGKFVINVLRNIGNPAKLSDIIEYIAGPSGTDNIKIVKTVQKILNKGRAYGFIEASEREYSLPSPVVIPEYKFNFILKNKAKWKTTNKHSIRKQNLDLSRKRANAKKKLKQKRTKKNSK